MIDEARLTEKLREMRNLIRIGKERIARHSPVWAVYLASETFRSLDDLLDELEGVSSKEEAAAGKRIREAV